MLLLILSIIPTISKKEKLIDPITVTVIIIIGGGTAKAAGVNPLHILFGILGFLAVVGLPFAALISLWINGTAGTLTPTTIAAAIWVLGNLAALIATIALDAEIAIFAIFNLLFILICIFPINLHILPLLAIIIGLSVYKAYKN